MNITHQSILRKIEQELAKAKQAEKSQNIREHIHSMKALCELLLEEGKQGEVSAQSLPPQPQRQVNVMPQQSLTQSSLSLKEERLETDDGANGDSLFDF